MSDIKSKRSNGSCIRTYAGHGYEVTYFARKHGLTRQQARDLIRKVGHDRTKLNEAAMLLKG
ncbi:MAG: DUF3606 domain-containing protein [Novosphingobium sp.]|nr:DUF3606 domain-containing protein [Novosphingobium sp.]